MAKRALLRRAGLFALAVAALLCFAGLFQHGLWTPDEPREAEVGREMLLAKFSAMPTLGGVRFLEKPPLGAWIAAASYAVFGVNDWAGRVPYALLAVGTIGIAYLMGRRAGGRLAGLCAALALATTWQFAETSHRGVLDVALTFFVAGGHLAFLSLLKSGERSRAPYLPYVAIGACAGLAFLTKSVIGPALMCAPPILAAAAMRDWEYVRRVLPRAFVAATLGVVAFGLPWVLALAHTEGGGWPAVKTCLVTNTIGRSVGGSRDGYGFSGHDHWFGYYLVAVWSVTAPWILALPAAVRSGTLSRSWRGGRTAFCGFVFLAGLVLLSIPSGKRELYLVPLLPAASVVPGVWLSRIGTRRGGSWDVVTLRVLKTVACVAFVAIVGAMAYVALGAPIPNWTWLADWLSPSDFTRDALAAERRTITFTMIGVGLLILGPRLWAKRRWIPADAPALDVAASLATLFLIVHGAAYPLLDPLRDMSAGVREIASLVPEGETIVALRSDETLRAVVPFYTGRAFENALNSRLALQAIDAGRATRLLVMEGRDERISPELRARLVPLKTVRVNATRAVDVYAVRAP